MSSYKWTSQDLRDYEDLLSKGKQEMLMNRQWSQVIKRYNANYELSNTSKIISYFLFIIWMIAKTIILISQYPFLAFL